MSANRGWLIVVLGLSCSSANRGVGPLRFHHQPPVLAVDDKRPIEVTPKADQLGLVEYYWRNDVVRPTRRALTIGGVGRATNVNSLGDVPDSSWFTNRALSPQEIRDGPGKDGPDRSEPWRVTGVKVGGAAIGITIEDARGDTYLLKFDEKGHPESETSADVVVQRLTWAFGYNVPDNNVVTFKRSRLVLDKQAVVKNRSDGERPMTDNDLEGYLALVETDGESFRALASRFIEGEVIGGMMPEGTLTGDTNDRVPHERRRDLRGQRILFAWVNHVDLKSKNTLVVVTKDKYVKRYWLDFGKSLGTWARIDNFQQYGFRSSYGTVTELKSFFSLGLYVRPWERTVSYPKYKGLGYLDVRAFDPKDWVANHEWQPVEAADRFDEFWGAKILMRFTEEHIRAAVSAGKYSDRRTSAELITRLLGRQRKLGAYAFSRVAPLSDIAVTMKADGAKLCFDDLWLRYQFGGAKATSYRARTYDGSGTTITRLSDWIPSEGPRSCIGGLATRGDYTIAALEVKRGGAVTPKLNVHLSRGKNGWRVIGLDRR